MRRLHLKECMGLIPALTDTIGATSWTPCLEIPPWPSASCELPYGVRSLWDCISFLLPQDHSFLEGTGFKAQIFTRKFSKIKRKKNN